MKNYNNEKKQQVAEKIVEKYHTDERVSAVNRDALAVCGVIAILYCLGKFFYVAVRGSFAVSEFVLLMIMALAITIVNMKNHIYDFPKTITGRELNVEMNRSGLLNRIKYYLSDSLFFAVVLTAFDVILDKEKNDIHYYVVDFFIVLVIFFLFDFIIVEWKVKKI